jgi:O-antigen ligase
MLPLRLQFFGLFCFSLSWLVYDHYRPWVNFHAESLAVAGVLILVLGLLARSTSALNAPKICLWISLVALLPWLQFALGISLFAGDALIVSLFLCATAAAVWCGFQMADTASANSRLGVNALMFALAAAAILSAGIGIAQWFGVSGPLGMYALHSDLGDRAMGNLGQANQLATLLLMGLVAYAWMYERRVIGIFAFTLGASFMTLALVMAHSRSGMVGVLLIAAFFVWKIKRMQTRLTSPPVVTWAIVYAVGTAMLPLVSGALMLSNASSFMRPEAIGQRVTMWKQVGYAVWQSPWLGYGWNQTPTAHAAGAVAFPSSVTYTNAHSVLMDLLAWNGIPLGLLLTGVFAWWFLSRLWACTHCDSVFAMAALLPFAVHSMVEYPFAYAYFLVATGLFVGVVEAGHDGAGRVSVNLKWVLSIVIMWAGVGSYVVYEYLLVEEDFQVMRFENLRIGQTVVGYEPPRVWMLSQMGAMLIAARMKAHPEMSSSEIETLRTVSSRFAYGAVRFRFAQALALNGDPQSARIQLAIIKGMYGDEYYAACKAELQELARTKYPQLAAILTP